MKRQNLHCYLRKEGMPTQGKHELTYGVSKATQHLGLSSPDLEATHIHSSTGHVVHDYLYERWVAGDLCHSVIYIQYSSLYSTAKISFYYTFIISSVLTIIHTLCIFDLCVQLRQPGICKILICISTF